MKELILKDKFLGINRRIVMSKYKTYLLPLLFSGFVVMGVSAYFQSRPEDKNQEIYQQIKVYSPYYLDKRFGGLQIMSKTDKSFKEQPDNMEVFHRLDWLEKEWGKKHLRIQNSKLVVVNDNNTTLAIILIQTKEDRRFIEQFYEITE